ncbi:MAG: DUF2461 domain-containing protein [Woeseia sp.]
MASRKPLFSTATCTFLQELERNNNRDWFNANKSRYEEDVLDPALRFIAAMQDPLAEISTHFQAVPKRTGGSLMRVYRDTRFAKDKTPYKTNIGIQFRHERGKDVHAPGFYLHIDPHQVFLGVGIWHPDSRTLAAIRQRIHTRQAEWQRVKADPKFRRQFEPGGESLTRPPRGYAADHPLIDDLRRKDFIAVRNLDKDAVLKPAFVKSVAGSFAAGTPLMRFLCKAAELPF